AARSNRGTFGHRENLECPGFPFGFPRFPRFPVSRHLVPCSRPASERSRSATGGRYMRYVVMTLIVCAALVPGLGTRGQDRKEAPKGDEAKIKAVIERLNDAWNEHDM